ncbi:MAG: tRNA (cytidine(34)-2'-O)-methyltransferase, partial [Clostridiales bacterium]|nr:tRNA (cytidine(34)-2'-O)-methyltransferase [Clostridiales bacterium]
MNIVLLEPEIPANTGNIGRTCVATNTVLHLIRPLGFSTDDKALKRAGLDYWSELDVRYYDSFDEFTEKNKGAELYFATTKAERTYADVSYSENTYKMFGKESAGIPEEILVEHRQQCIRIPM